MERQLLRPCRQLTSTTRSSCRRSRSIHHHQHFHHGVRLSIAIRPSQSLRAEEPSRSATQQTGETPNKESQTQVEAQQSDTQPPVSTAQSSASKAEAHQPVQEINKSQPNTYDPSTSDPIPTIQSWLTSSPEWQSLSSSSSTTKESPLPAHLHPSSLITNHIATASSTPAAHRATIQSAMSTFSRRDDLSFGFDSLNAQALRFGKVVRFRDEDEKGRAVALANEMSGESARRIAVRQGKSAEAGKVEFRGVDGEVRKGIVDRVLRGRYDEGGELRGDGNKEKGRGGVEVVKKKMALNETFTKKPGREFGGVVERYLNQ